MNLFERYSTEKNGERVITEEGFQKLISDGIIRETVIRDQNIRELYKKLRENKMNAGRCIEEIQQKHYPHLQYDTLRKLIYVKGK